MSQWLDGYTTWKVGHTASKYSEATYIKTQLYNIFLKWQEACFEVKYRNCKILQLEKPSL